MWRKSGCWVLMGELKKKHCISLLVFLSFCTFFYFCLFIRTAKNAFGLKPPLSICICIFICISKPKHHILDNFVFVFLYFYICLCVFMCFCFSMSWAAVGDQSRLPAVGHSVLPSFGSRGIPISCASTKTQTYKGLNYKYNYKYKCKHTNTNLVLRFFLFNCNLPVLWEKGFRVCIKNVPENTKN